MKLTDGKARIEMTAGFASGDCAYVGCEEETECYDSISFCIEYENKGCGKGTVGFRYLKSEWIDALMEMMKVAAGTKEARSFEYSDEDLELCLMVTRVSDDVHVALTMKDGLRGTEVSDICQRFTGEEAVKLLCRELEEYGTVTCSGKEERK